MSRLGLLLASRGHLIGPRSHWMMLPRWRSIPGTSARTPYRTFTVNSSELHVHPNRLQIPSTPAVNTRHKTESQHGDLPRKRELPKRGLALALLAGALALVLGGVASTVMISDSPLTLTELYTQSVRSYRTLYAFGMIAFDYKWNLGGLDVDDPKYKKVRSAVHLRSAYRMLDLCQANKGVFIKAGQHMASLTHILPSEYTSVMSILQDQAPHVNYRDVESVFMMEFGRLPSEIFLNFERTPIASASLAQVHRAVWVHPTTGKEMEVAVKVQYPGLREKVAGDSKTLALVMKGVTLLFPEFQFEWLVPEFRKSIAMELDFVNEGRNSEMIAANFKGHKQFHVPAIVWPLTTHRILTMEYIHAVKINDLRGLQRLGVARSDVARLLIELFSEQIFVHGFVHSDPHPGNIMVRAKWAGWKRVPEIVLIDHGLYRRLPNEVRLNYCKLWKALVLGNKEDVELYGRKLGAGDYHKYFSVMLTLRPNIGRLDVQAEAAREEVKKLVRGAFDRGAIEAIATLLERLPRDLLLVLRNNDLLMSINKDLGNPVNRFIIMAQTSIRGIGHSHKRGLAAYLRSRLEVISFNTRLQAFAALMWVARVLHHIRGFFQTGQKRQTLIVDPDHLMEEITGHPA
eukprot:TRINITY_DN7792_c0_g1_i3.p1 TRINITY_DN7792_c0_g1~~TRINITY_DN7792_c0_g1_i3.p1  ORF type:complete len:644 (+),score=56.02 TRINITY_DN7792_c0_g1_i3:47-1933(+)